MFGAISKATNSSFQKGMTVCRSIYVKKVMKLLAFIFEQPSYSLYFGVSASKITPITVVALITTHAFLTLVQLTWILSFFFCKTL